MALEFMDSISKYIPSIKGPKSPLSLREKFVWTGIVLSIYFVLYNTYAIGVSQQAVSQPTLQLISIIFAAKIGSIITIGIGPIVLASIVLQLVVGSGIVNMDLNDMQQKARFQSLQKLAAIIIGVIEAIVYVNSGFVPVASASYEGIVILQLSLGAIFIVFLDEIMTKYGISSGINLFIAAGVSYAIVGGTISILLPEAAAAISAGGASALVNAIEAFGPLFFAIIIFIVSIYFFEMQVELPLAFEQFRGVGGRLPIPFLYVNVLPVILAESLTMSLTFWFKFLAGVHGNLANLAKFFALYQIIPTSTGASTSELTGGLLYLISPQFPMPYSSTYGGVGGYGPYFTYLATHTSQLFLPWGGVIAVPEWIHIIIYTLVLVVLCVIFGKFWIEMTGQSPKKMAEQLGGIGWQIPGFRRDPRIVENVLNKYIPQLTVLGSIFVGLLAALATLSGAIGSGIGILLTVGIVYMLYQQLKQEQLYETYPFLQKIAS
ncbi:MAG: preprotein translocase subunit SecY [Candidatus Micrarchaeia archaeon]